MESILAGYVFKDDPVIFKAVPHSAVQYSYYDSLGRHVVIMRQTTPTYGAQKRLYYSKLLLQKSPLTYYSH